MQARHRTAEIVLDSRLAADLGMKVTERVGCICSCNQSESDCGREPEETSRMIDLPDRDLVEVFAIVEDGRSVHVVI
jgi:hypothetical protein